MTRGIERFRSAKTRHLVVRAIEPPPAVPLRDTIQLVDIPLSVVPDRPEDRGGLFDGEGLDPVSGDLVQLQERSPERRPFNQIEGLRELKDREGVEVERGVLES